MTPKERLQTVLMGEIPDAVPWFGDLSHWYSVHSGKGYLPTNAVASVDEEMIRVHRELGVGIYLNMGTFYDVDHEDPAIKEEVFTESDLFTWRIHTPLGTVTERRRFSKVSLSWNIEKRMVSRLEDLRILGYALGKRRFKPRYERYLAWEEAIGEIGLPFAAAQYSGLGLLISRAMGVEATIYAIHDAPDAVSGFIETVNGANLGMIDVLAKSPAQVVLHSDNLSSDLQSPPLFERFSAPYYEEMAARLHGSGKHLAVHIDGRLRGLLGALASCGVDVADAVTPAPMGDLTPAQCREESGPGMILWGGIPPSVWEASTSDMDFAACVKSWLDLRKSSPRLVLAPGDQVPPGASWQRIKIVAELVQEYGKYQR